MSSPPYPSAFFPIRVVLDLKPVGDTRPRWQLVISIYHPNGYWVLDDGEWMQDNGCWKIDVGHGLASWNPEPEHRT
jgi:hypothetical protein